LLWQVYASSALCSVLLIQNNSCESCKSASYAIQDFIFEPHLNIAQFIFSLSVSGMRALVCACTHAHKVPWSSESLTWYICSFFSFLQQTLWQPRNCYNYLAPQSIIWPPNDGTNIKHKM
jgi:hypothetical protein